jgi:alanyl-tRNA synthetase
MQQFKSKFRDELYSGVTLSNIQSCIRLNDLDSLGDGTHLGYFNMMGLFSFRHWTVPQTVTFWMEFLKRIHIEPTHVTIHPDRPDWSSYHMLPVKLDPNCTWTDGQIGGYCTEFYVGDVEIGNIVNPLGTCIDVGFGLERLDSLVNHTPVKSIEDYLCDVIRILVDSDIQPSNTKQGYVLRRLLRTLHKRGGQFNHPIFNREIERQHRLLEQYEKLKPKYPGKSKKWWYETHGIEVP